jgi:branched-chain amino acid transport system substrate-binding protein
MLTGSSGTTFARQWGELQIPCAPIGLNNHAQSTAIVEGTSTKMNYLATGALVSYAGITDRTAPFFEKFIEQYKEYPGYGSTSYDAVWIYKEAVEKAGTLDSDKVVTWLEMTDFAGASNRILFGGSNTPFPHDLLSSQTKGYAIMPMVQWLNGEQVCTWPSDLKGSQKYQIPPWMATTK